MEHSPLSIKKRIQFYEEMNGETGPIDITNKPIGGRRPKGSEAPKKDLNDANKELEECFVILDKQIRECEEVLMPEVKKYNYCQECKRVFKSALSYASHIELHNNEQCICRKCGIVFQTNFLYLTHLCTNEKSDTDTIPTTETGTQTCPVCNKKYADVFLLGEHFSLTHNNYDILCSLDSTIHNGFPGFDILCKIEMINKLDRRTHKQLVKKKDECYICRHNFSMSSEHPDKRPIILICCNRYICRDCMIQYIIISDSIICPYCRKDHTRTDWDYITYITISEKTDKKRWIPWWENHMEIFN